MNLLVKSPLRFSLIATIFVILMFFILILLDKNPVIYSSNIIFIGPLLSLFLFFAVKLFRDTNPDGLRFWQGFSIGILYTLFFTLFYSIVLWSDAVLFETDHFDEYRLVSVDRVIAQKEIILDRFDEKYFEELKAASRDQSNIEIILRLARNCFFIGALATPLISLFMRTSEPKRV